AMLPQATKNASGTLPCRGRASGALSCSAISSGEPNYPAARMKILRCIHSLNPVIGGPLESVKQLSRVLARRGHEVEVVSLDAPTDPSLREFPATVHALGPGHGSYGYSARFVPWLKERHAQYDAVVVHGIWQYNSFGTWRALHKAVTPYFVVPHGMLDTWLHRRYSLSY